MAVTYLNALNSLSPQAPESSRAAQQQAMASLYQQAAQSQLAAMLGVSSVSSIGAAMIPEGGYEVATTTSTLAGLYAKVGASLAQAISESPEPSGEIAAQWTPADDREAGIAAYEDCNGIPFARSELASRRAMTPGGRDPAHSDRLADSGTSGISASTSSHLTLGSTGAYTGTTGGLIDFTTSSSVYGLSTATHSVIVNPKTAGSVSGWKWVSGGPTIPDGTGGGE